MLTSVYGPRGLLRRLHSKITLSGSQALARYIPCRAQTGLFGGGSQLQQLTTPLVSPDIVKQTSESDMQWSAAITVTFRLQPTHGSPRLAAARHISPPARRTTPPFVCSCRGLVRSWLCTLLPVEQDSSCHQGKRISCRQDISCWHNILTGTHVCKLCFSVL